MPEERYCDFCLAKNPIRKFACQAFTPLDAFPYAHIDGDWYACERCGQLVDEDNFDALLDVQIKAEQELFDGAEDWMKFYIRSLIHQLQQKFRRLRMQTQ